MFAEGAHWSCLHSHMLQHWLGSGLPTSKTQRLILSIWLGKSLHHAQTVVGGSRCGGIVWVHTQCCVQRWQVCRLRNYMGCAVGQRCAVGLYALGRLHATVLHATVCGTCRSILHYFGRRLEIKSFCSWWNLIFQVTLYTVGTLDCRATVCVPSLWICEIISIVLRVLHELPSFLFCRLHPSFSPSSPSFVLE